MPADGLALIGARTSAGIVKTTKLHMIYLIHLAFKDFEYHFPDQANFMWIIGAIPWNFEAVRMSITRLFLIICYLGSSSTNDKMRPVISVIKLG